LNFLKRSSFLKGATSHVTTNPVASAADVQENIVNDEDVVIEEEEDDDYIEDSIPDKESVNPSLSVCPESIDLQSQLDFQQEECPIPCLTEGHCGAGGDSSDANDKAMPKIVEREEMKESSHISLRQADQQCVSVATQVSNGHNTVL